jgi:hypothetical protein
MRSGSAALLVILMWVTPAAAQDEADPLATPADPAPVAVAPAEPVAEATMSAPASTGSRGPMGAGISSMLGPAVTGPTLVYDPGAFHLEAIVAFGNQDPTTMIALGGRFWYHVHRGTRADFSVGGGLGFVTVDQDGADAQNSFDLEAGAQVRAFLVDNVAVSAALGLVVVAGDGPDDPIDLRGDLFGAAGIVYFF